MSPWLGSEVVSRETLLPRSPLQQTVHGSLKLPCQHTARLSVRVARAWEDGICETGVVGVNWRRPWALPSLAHPASASRRLVLPDQPPFSYLPILRLPVCLSSPLSLRLPKLARVQRGAGRAYHRLAGAVVAPGAC